MSYRGLQSTWQSSYKECLELVCKLLVPVRPLVLGCQRRRSSSLFKSVGGCYLTTASPVLPKLSWRGPQEIRVPSHCLGWELQQNLQRKSVCVAGATSDSNSEFCPSLSVLLSGIFTSSHLLLGSFSHLHGVKPRGISQCSELGWSFHHSLLELHSSHQLVTGKFHAMLLSDAPHFLQACGMFLYSPGCKSLPSMDYYYTACIIHLRGSFKTNQITGYCLMLQLKLERIDHKNNCSGSRSGYK